MATLYERLGGANSIDTAVDIFYEKVLADPLLIPFFAHTDMTKQKRMQRAFLTMAFGGPGNYSGRNMRDAHTKAVSEGLNDEHFDAVVGHLAATLKQLGVGDDDINDVAGVAESIRDDVLNK
ncbi:MAG: group 1 truncated hemoglobin [Coxiellaceae bacterium]|nr:group 1 truncated hemoglobin [Coxiellaceae bacterium]